MQSIRRAPAWRGMSEFPGRIELLTSDSTSKGAHSSQAAMFGPAALPLYPFHLPRRNNSSAVWVYLSTDCTHTSTNRTLRRTKRKPNSGLGWAGRLRLVQRRHCPKVLLPPWLKCNLAERRELVGSHMGGWRGSEGGGRGHIKSHYASKRTTVLGRQNDMRHIYSYI